MNTNSALCNSFSYGLLLYCFISTTFCNKCVSMAGIQNLHYPEDFSKSMKDYVRDSYFFTFFNHSFILLIILEGAQKS